MTKSEAMRLAKEALHTLRAQSGDEETVKEMFIWKMQADRRLHEALTVLGTARLWESQLQHLRH
ncbi:hypothetical protein [Paraburkholderia xenovorans]